jgi:hypothetical protein
MNQRGTIWEETNGHNRNVSTNMDIQSQNSKKMGMKKMEKWKREGKLKRKQNNIGVWEKINTNPKLFSYIRFLHQYMCECDLEK